MDGLPSDNGAFDFFKPLLWAAAGDTSVELSGAGFLLVRDSKDSDLKLSRSRASGELSPTALMSLK